MIGLSPRGLGPAQDHPDLRDVTSPRGTPDRSMPSRFASLLGGWAQRRTIRIWGMLRLRAPARGTPDRSMPLTLSLGGTPYVVPTIRKGYLLKVPNILKGHLLKQGLGYVAG